jgi:hypothetical protein
MADTAEEGIREDFLAVSRSYFSTVFEFDSSLAFVINLSKNRKIRKN